MVVDDPRDLYPTLAELASWNGVAGPLFVWRMNRGWSARCAVYEPAESREVPCHQRIDTCKRNGVSNTLYHRRMYEHGWDPVRAMTTPPAKSAR